MVAFLGGSMRIPLTACIFAFEALGGFYNILPLTAAVTAAFILVEVSGLSDFTSTVIKARSSAIFVLRLRRRFAGDITLTMWTAFA